MKRSKTISLYQLLTSFPDEDSAMQYVEEMRWHGKRVCPYCGEVHGQYALTRKDGKGYYKCSKCKKVYTVRTGTIFQRSHVSFQKWLMAIYLFLTERKGVSSLQLSKEIGVTQDTAWYMLQRIRHSCETREDVLLQGIVEADATYIGGRESNKHESKKLRAGRGTVGKTAVLGMKERKGKVRAVVLHDTSRAAVHSVLDSHVAQNATLMTDEHSSYEGTKRVHKVVNHSAKQFVDGMASTNEIESVWACLKRSFYGIYHSFSTKHLQRYVNEITFRLNEGNVEFDTIDRINSLLLTSFSTHTTYREIIAA